MSWKIEKRSVGRQMTIRLIGHMQAEHLQNLQCLIDASKPWIALDLEELSLVDLEAVRFLKRCQDDGVSLVRCSQFIKTWIQTERNEG